MNPISCACSLFALTCLSGLSVAAQPIDLSGEWGFQLDRDDRGTEQGLTTGPLKESVTLPGSLQEQGKGDRVTLDAPWTPSFKGQSDFFNSERYAPYRQPENIKVPFCLQPERMYVGAAWYQRDFELPKAWSDQRVVLRLERPHWVTQAWIDGKPLGEHGLP